MGVLSVTVIFRFQGSDQIEIKKLLRFTSSSLVVGGFLLAGLYSFICVTVPYGPESRRATFITGFSRPLSCLCSVEQVLRERTISDAECISYLSYNAVAVSGCWGSQVKAGKFLFVSSYVATSGALSVLLSLCMLWREAFGVGELGHVCQNKTVFIACNSADEPEVKRVCERLRNFGLEPWLYSERVAPGRIFQDATQDAIGIVDAAAIFFGSHGLGRWQMTEIRCLVTQCVEKRIPIIPVLLPGVKEIPKDLFFLREMNQVKLRKEGGGEGVRAIVWGVTGKKPIRKILQCREKT